MILGDLKNFTTKSLKRNLLKGRVILRFPVQILAMRLISRASVRTAAGEFFCRSDEKVIVVAYGICIIVVTYRYVSSLKNLYRYMPA
jgi:hypothetical protein